MNLDLYEKRLAEIKAKRDHDKRIAVKEQQTKAIEQSREMLARSDPQFSRMIEDENRYFKSLSEDSQRAYKNSVLKKAKELVKRLGHGHA
ncbi:MAG: hypothetical protein MN733_36875 [Nitrososphaera sp.]|nr:hypothetical protein [Nitrososphaera sp.]